MVYDWVKIGNRIKTARKEMKLTQAELADKLSLTSSSRQTIGEWEKGKLRPHLDYMLRMCEIFECELGYLLCEFDCKTRTATDITEATGLSEDAVKKLIIFNKSSISEVIGTLSNLILHSEFEKLFRAMHLHIYDFNNNRYRMDEQHAREFAEYLKCPVVAVNDYIESSSIGLIEASFKKILLDLK